MNDRALVGNAADAKQVKAASKKIRDRQMEADRHWKNVLATASGRFVLWNILQDFKTFESIWDGSDGRLHYNSGVQDSGHRIMRRINDLDPETIFVMMREATRRVKQEEAENQEARKRGHQADEEPGEE